MGEIGRKQKMQGLFRQEGTAPDPKKARRAQTKELRRERDAVAPTKTPSQVKAAQPMGGISKSQK